MIISKQNNKLLIKLAQDRSYQFLKNGTVLKKGADGRFRTVGSDRHGYTVVHYCGKKLVVARALAVREALNKGITGTLISKLLTNTVILHKNRKSTDNRLVNLELTRVGKYPKTQKRKLTTSQIKKMVALFCEGYSIAKIARRFRRKISRSYISRVIRHELDVMQNVIVDFRVTNKELMDVKNCYGLYNTEVAVRFMFEKQNSGLRFIKIVSANPIDQDGVLMRIQAEYIE